MKKYLSQLLEVAKHRNSLLLGALMLFCAVISLASSGGVPFEIPTSLVGCLFVSMLVYERHAWQTSRMTILSYRMYRQIRSLDQVRELRREAERVANQEQLELYKSRVRKFTIGELFKKQRLLFTDETTVGSLEAQPWMDLNQEETDNWFLDVVRTALEIKTEGRGAERRLARDKELFDQELAAKTADAQIVEASVKEVIALCPNSSQVLIEIEDLDGLVQSEMSQALN